MQKPREDHEHPESDSTNHTGTIRPAGPPGRQEQKACSRLEIYIYIYVYIYIYSYRIGCCAERVTRMRPGKLTRAAIYVIRSAMYMI